jgi:1-acyl-sn-glycerol-3-phosphate acyltransferase
VRGGAALGLVLAWLGVAALPSVVALGFAARRVSTTRRLSWISAWARTQAKVALGLLRAGGARFKRVGHVRTDQAGLIVMNHQSVLDIPTAILMSGPIVPAFVTRSRYTRVPMIGAGLRCADCPIVDPGRDREEALRTLAGAVQNERALLIYPEGHRTPDGTLQPFRTAGLLAMLEARRVPVWLVATDGFWSGRRLVDLVRLDRIRGRTVVVGRFDPPEDAAALPGFLAVLEARLAEALAALRSAHGEAEDGTGGCGQEESDGRRALPIALSLSSPGKPSARGRAPSSPAARRSASRLRPS